MDMWDLMDRRRVPRSLQALSQGMSLPSPVDRWSETPERIRLSAFQLGSINALGQSHEASHELARSYAPKYAPPRFRNREGSDVGDRPVSDDVSVDRVSMDRDLPRSTPTVRLTFERPDGENASFVLDWYRVEFLGQALTLIAKERGLVLE